MLRAAPIAASAAQVKPGCGRPCVVPTRASPPASTLHPALTRRQLGLQLLSGAAALGLQTQPADAAALGAGPGLTPYQRQRSLEYGLTADGRLRGCPTDVQPNCLSTSSTNDSYIPAWEAPQGSPAQVMKDFESALAEVAPEARLIDSFSSAEREYRRFVVSDPLFDHDDIEVLVQQQQGGYSEPPLVLLRSMAAQVKYIWPITQPITDFGTQRKRLRAVRDRLGWRLRGCDLLECFEE